MPIILAIWEKDQEDCGSRLVPISKRTIAKWAGGMAQAVAAYFQTPVPSKEEKKDNSIHLSKESNDFAPGGYL
jgi:hypothetical protein